MGEIATFLVPRRACDPGFDVELHHPFFSARLGAACSPDELLELVEGQRFELRALSFLTYEGIPLIHCVTGGGRRLDRGGARGPRDHLDALIRGS
jgi:hypothetical protein